MSTEIKIFKNEMFGEIRTLVNEKGETFFVGKDVAQALGYSNTRKALLDHVDKEDREDGVTIRDAIGRDQKATFINESGLYALVLSSKLPQAREFKRWVTAEVLPQIRQTGGNKIVARTIARSNLPADDCLTATQVAESLDVDVKQLNHFLVDKGVMYWSYGRYKLTAKYADCGYAEERKFHYHALNGARKQRPYLVWTKQGKEFIKSIYR